MPVVGGDCLGCQLAFPAPCTAIYAHTSSAVKSAEPSSHGVAISINDHVHVPPLPNRTSSFGQHRGSLDTHAVCARKKESVLRESKCQAQHLTSHKNENPERIVGMVTSCLQQLGVAQAQSEYVIQNVKMCLDKIENAVDESAPVSNPIRSVRKRSTDSGSSADRNSNKGKSTKKRGRTMMMCNIPCRVSHCDFIEALDSNGFGSCYEFVHLPCRYMREDSNLGYGFVHFFREADAERFALAFEGYHFSEKGSTKTCTVKIADCQGHDANSRRLPKKVRKAQRTSAQ
jgi:hypothetical protein